MNKDKAYHQIALACLKTLQNQTAASASDPKAALFDSIDAAFNQQYSLLLAELADCHERLNAIAGLDSSRHNLDDAKRIALAKAPHH